MLTHSNDVTASHASAPRKTLTDQRLPEVGPLARSAKGPFR